MQPFLDQLAVTVRTTAIRVGIASLIMVLFWIGSAILYRIIARIESRLTTRRELLELAGRTVKITLLILGVLTALGTAGINFSALVAGLGLSGFALGFALRDILSNVLAGFLILFYSPFDNGDFINVSGLEGKVIRIDLRYTSLDSGDKLVLIPNSNLFTNPITVRREPDK